MSDFTTGNTPGFQAASEADGAEVTWSGRQGQDLIATKKITLVSTAADTRQHAHDHAPRRHPDGGRGCDRQGRYLFARRQRRPADRHGHFGKAPGHARAGVATDRFTQMLVHGLVREGELLSLDARARQQLGGRFTFDRETSPQAGVLMHPRGVFRKSANYTVTADDNGLLFLATRR